MINLNCNRCDDKYWFEFLSSTIPSQAHSLHFFFLLKLMLKFLDIIVSKALIDLNYLLKSCCFILSLHHAPHWLSCQGHVLKTLSSWLVGTRTGELCCLVTALILFDLYIHVFAIQLSIVLYPKTCYNKSFYKEVNVYYPYYRNPNA